MITGSAGSVFALEMKTLKWRRVPAAAWRTAESAAPLNVVIKQREPGRAGREGPRMK